MSDTLPSGAARFDEAATEAALREILREPPFADAALARDALLARLRDWLNGLGGSLHVDEPVLFWGGMVLLVVIAVSLSVHIAYSLRAVWGAVRRAGREDLEDAQPSSATDDWAEVRAALERGEPRGAIEAAFASVRRRLKPDAYGETPRAWAAMLSSELDPPQRAALVCLLRLHESVCYGGRAPEPTEAEQAVAWARCVAGDPVSEERREA